MKIEVEITKSKFFAIFGALLFIAGLIVATAYNSGGTGGAPATFGHSVDELDWSKTIPSGINVSGTLKIGSNFVLNPNTIPGDSYPWLRLQTPALTQSADLAVGNLWVGGTIQGPGAGGVGSLSDYYVGSCYVAGPNAVPEPPSSQIGTQRGRCKCNLGEKFMLIEGGGGSWGCEVRGGQGTTGVYGFCSAGGTRWSCFK